MYTPKTKPMDHQKTALLRAANAPVRPCPEDAFAYLMDMGTGKSKVIIDEFGVMATNGGPQDLFVLAPAGSYRNWYEDKSDMQRSEINTHMDPAFRERLVDVGWVSGGRRDTKQRIEAMLRVRDRPRALFMNIEALSTVQAARDLAHEFLSQRLAYMAVDESTTIKGHNSKRTKTVVDLGTEAAVRRIATGLLTPKSPMDIFSQFDFLDWRILGHKSYYSFKARYAVTKKMDTGGRKFDVIVGYKNIEELQSLIRPYSYRVLKKDCLDLEPKVYTTRDVELTDEQRKMYDELKHFATSSIGESGKYVSTSSVITQIMRLQQINCGHVVDEERREHDIQERRTDALLEVLEQHRGKAIIWVPFNRTILKVAKRLREEYGEKSVALFWGGNKGTRSEDERRFLGDPECRFMLASQGAGMRGNTWVCADLVVYYANNYDLEQRDQSEDRAHRKGQVNRVTYVDLIARNTVDEKIVTALRNKIDMATMITGENYRQWLI